MIVMRGVGARMPFSIHLYTRTKDIVFFHSHFSMCAMDNRYFYLKIVLVIKNEQRALFSTKKYAVMVAVCNLMVKIPPENSFATATFFCNFEFILFLKKYNYCFSQRPIRF